MMKLMGSKTSPFVRRIRLLLAEERYDFEVVDVFSEKDRPQILSANPIGKVPVFENEGEVLWDSRIITKYILEKQGRALPTWQEELELDLVDGANDTGVILFLVRRHNLDPNWENRFSRLQLERLDRILQRFETKTPRDISSLTGSWLYCLLDWLIFREVKTLEKFPNLQKFHAAQAHLPAVRATDPRL